MPTIQTGSIQCERYIVINRSVRTFPGPVMTARSFDAVSAPFGERRMAGADAQHPPNSGRCKQVGTRYSHYVKV